MKIELTNNRQLVFLDNLHIMQSALIMSCKILLLG